MNNLKTKINRKRSDLSLIKAYEDSNLNKLEPISTFRQAAPQFVAVGVKNILLFVYGMTAGFPTIVIPAIQGGSGMVHKPNDIVLNREQISWFSSIHLIFVPLGCIVSGPFCQPIGKLRAMQIVNILIIISWLLYHFATSIEFVYAATCLQGFAGGIMEVPTLTYVAEITEPNYRGVLSASGSAFIILGIFVQFVLGSLLTWRRIAAICTLFPVLSILAIFFIPESPTWLIRQNRFREAIKSLQWLRGWVPENHVENEFNELYDHLMIKNPEPDFDNVKSKCLNKVSVFKKSYFWKPFFLVALTYFIGHFSGKTTLQTYAVQIFHTLKAPINKYYATVLLGLCELISTILCVVLVHFTGKRPLVFVSLIGTGLCFFGTATYAYFIDDLPGYGINNIVLNASLITSKKDFISTDNLTMIFQKEEDKITIDTQYFSMDLTTQLTNLDLTTQLTNLDLTTQLTNLDLTTIQLSDIDLFNFDDADGFENFTTTESDVLSTTLTYNNDEQITKKNFIPYENEIKKLKSRTESDIIIRVPNQEESLIFWVPLVLLLGAAFFAHLGIRILPWMLIGEVFPTNIRGTGTGLAGGSGYVFSFLANKFFLQMLAWLTLPGTFWLNSFVALFGIVILYFILPETEGRTLEEIEDYFTKKTCSNNNQIEMRTNILPNDTLPLPIGLLEVPINNHKSVNKSIAKDLPKKDLEHDKSMYSTYGKYNLAYENEVPIKQITHL